MTENTPTPTIDPRAGDRTLYPVGAEAQQLTRFDASRVLVRLEDTSVVYEDDWTPTTDLISGRVVNVRRTDCGAGCKCAGEVEVL